MVVARYINSKGDYSIGKVAVAFSASACAAPTVWLSLVTLDVTDPGSCISNMGRR